MKKLITIFVAIALFACLFAGCSGALEVDENHANESSFVRVEDGNSYWIVYHKETKVMYVFSTGGYGGYNAGSVCLLVNPDGTPMIWKGK